jgi:peptide deformylase
MIETMVAADGAGLAAPQVGVSKRIFVFRIGDDIHAIVNPRITRREGRKVGDEGCLSIPGVQAKVARAKRVIVTGRNEKNRPVEFECEDGDEQGRAATCIQHELDHLDGVMYIDKAIPESISWLKEAVDDDGEEIIVLEETTPEEIKAAYKARRFPPKTHVLDMLRERVEK